MSDTPQLTIVEINGVKMEVDLRQAKVVHQSLRVGSEVKLLAKSEYGDPKVHPGIIVGFEPFQDLPTIIVAYVQVEYSKTELKFAYINSGSQKKWDMVPSVDDHLPLIKGDVIKQFDHQISQKEKEIEDIRERKEYFLRHFAAFCIPEEQGAM